MNGFLTQFNFHKVQEHPKQSSDEGVMTFRSWRSYVVTLSRADLNWSSWPDLGKRTITWSTEVRIEEFKTLTSISFMWIQFIRRPHYQIPFVSYPKTNSKVRLMRMIKNKESFVVQITTRLFPTHISEP